VQKFTFFKISDLLWILIAVLKPEINHLPQSVGGHQRVVRIT